MNICEHSDFVDGRCWDCGITEGVAEVSSELSALRADRDAWKLRAEKARAEALEEAAKVADELDHGDCHDEGCPCDGGDLAARIRALIPNGY